MSRSVRGDGPGRTSRAPARREALARWLPAFGWAVVILALTSVPNPPPSLGAALPAGVDKVTHGALYLVLGALVGRALGESLARTSVLAAALVALSLFGALDELHQHLVPGRAADVADWLADSLGAAAGLFTAQIQLARARRETAP